jgi:uncharacterized protein YerC
MSSLTLAERIALDYVSAEECSLMRQLSADGATYKDIKLETGRHSSTISRHINRECKHA